MVKYEAIRLFVERATAIKSDFVVTDRSASAVTEICHRLDGLPLAIELAAARVKILPPQAMLLRLQNRLQLLTGGDQDSPARQQTLRDALEWSYSLLNSGDQVLFRRLAVFMGGCALEAIEAVCNVDGCLDSHVLDRVASLVDKSLLKQEEGIGGEPRFVMLETIHEYAGEKLEESGEREEVRRSHALYFLRLAEEAEPHLLGPDQTIWLDRLEEKYDNLRAALQWNQGKDGDAKLGLDMVVIWNTRYIAMALDAIRAEGLEVREEDVARLSPLRRRHINMLGRYHFSLPEAQQRGELRPLRDPGKPDDLPL